MKHICMIGVPKEVKPQEGRVGITPSGVRMLTKIGIKVGVEQNAGCLSGFSDGEYLAAGAAIYTQPGALYDDASIIVKVKEPTQSEYGFLPLLKGKVLFTYLHLAGVDPELTKLLLANQVTAIAYENVTCMVDGYPTLPLLIPMSKIAGTQAMRGALLRHKKERYCDLETIILGGGVVGEAALCEALASNVRSVAVFESRDERARELRRKYSSNPSFAVFALSLLNEKLGRELLHGTDIIISGVKLPGDAAAPMVLDQSHFRIMKKHAYIADVAIDQGGSTAWSKVTKPGETFTKGKKRIVFSCVPNIPGSTVPAEATEALTRVTLPFVRTLARAVRAHGVNEIASTLVKHPDLCAGLQTWQGKLLNHAAAEKYGLQELYVFSIK
jgi:alanine dehydrogenase